MIANILHFFLWNFTDTMQWIKIWFHVKTWSETMFFACFCFACCRLVCIGMSFKKITAFYISAWINIWLFFFNCTGLVLWPCTQSRSVFGNISVISYENGVNFQHLVAVINFHDDHIEKWMLWVEFTAADVQIDAWNMKHRSQYMLRFYSRVTKTSTYEFDLRSEDRSNASKMYLHKWK